MRSPRPLFRLDPGWLFVAAGLAMLVAVVLVPQQQARREAELGLAPLQFAKDRLLERHARYDLAIFQLDEQEPAVMDRLVRSKLHLRPLDADRGDGTIYISSAIDQPVPDWIDRHLQADAPMPRAPRTTALATLVGSGIRLWVIGAATFSIFIGLVLGGAGEPVAREVARRLLRIPSGGAAEEAVQPHIFGDEEEEAEEEAAEQAIAEPASVVVASVVSPNPMAGAAVVADEDDLEAAADAAFDAEGDESTADEDEEAIDAEAEFEEEEEEQEEEEEEDEEEDEDDFEDEEDEAEFEEEEEEEDEGEEEEADDDEAEDEEADEDDFEDEEDEADVEQEEEADDE
ncbi:MAG: hypothetical protein GY741_12640, partial [Phycisphaeraceae bacterium]|nr:hypothetical protein [Phycisphaeraceae bacterium]